MYDQISFSRNKWKYSLISKPYNTNKWDLGLRWILIKLYYLNHNYDFPIDN